MAERTVKNIEIGQLVTWYESYADGFMTKDYGRGIVLKINTYNYGFSSGPHKSYTVYRDKHKDTMGFCAEELEPLKIKRNQ